MGTVTRKDCPLWPLASKQHSDVRERMERPRVPHEYRGLLQ